MNLCNERSTPSGVSLASALLSEVPEASRVVLRVRVRTLLALARRLCGWANPPGGVHTQAETGPGSAEQSQKIRTATWRRYQ